MTSAAAGVDYPTRWKRPPFIKNPTLRWAIFVGAGIYLALALTFLRIHRLLRDESRQREAHLQELNGMRANLEQRVTERTRELGYAKDFLQAIMDHVPDAILTCDANFIIHRQ